MAKFKYLTSPPKISTMPPGVPYIIGNEAAERFSYYGMNSILTIFMTKYLLDKMGHLQRDAAGASRSMVSHIRLRTLFSAYRRRSSGGRGLRKILGRSFGCRSCIAADILTLALMGSPVAHTIEPRLLARRRFDLDRNGQPAASSRVFQRTSAISLAIRTSIS